MAITGEPGGPPAKTGNSGRRHQRGHPRGARHRSPPTRTSCAPAEGQIVDTSLMEAALQQTYWHAAIYFATGESPRADRLGAPADRAVPGVPRERRLDQHRRREPGELGAHRRRARPSRVARDPRFRANTARMRNRELLAAQMNAVLGTRTRANGSARSTPPACPPAPCTRSARRSRIRRRSRAAWSSN